MIVAGSRTEYTDFLTKSAAELAPLTQEQINRAKPKTMVIAGGSSKNSFFGNKTRDYETLKKYRNLLDQGGLVTTGVELYPLLMLAGGYKFVGDKTGEIQQWADSINLFSILWSQIMDAVWLGDAFSEIVGTFGSKLSTELESFGQDINLLEDIGTLDNKVIEYAGTLSGYSDIVTLAPRDPIDFIINHDDFGRIKSYTQVKDHNTGAGIKLKPEYVSHLVLIPKSGSLYGRGLAERAYDDIVRDLRIAEASTEAIYRHGFRKYHIQVGTSGETIDKSVMTAVSNEFQNITHDNEFVTVRDVDITNIDEGGLEQIDKYNDISLSRVCASIGLTEEMLGLRRGSTDATAVSRIKVFYKKITAFQRATEHSFNQIIDRKTGNPGSIKLKFFDPDPTDEAIKAAWISDVMKASPANPFSVFPVAWIQQEFNIDANEWTGTGSSPTRPQIIEQYIKPKPIS
jgi:hypothetical protein